MSYCSCSLFFVERVGGWDLGGEDPSCGRDAGACVVQKEEWGGCALPLCEHKPCLAARSPAAARGLSQPKQALHPSCRGVKGLLIKAGG